MFELENLQVIYSQQNKDVINECVCNKNNRLPPNNLHIISIWGISEQEKSLIQRAHGTL